MCYENARGGINNTRGCRDAGEGQGVRATEGKSLGLGFLYCKMKGLEEVI